MRNQRAWSSFRLSDCVSHDPAVAELFICGSESFAVIAKDMRDRFSQAVLPLKDFGNVWDMRIDQVLDNSDVQSIIAALGAGIDLGGSTMRPPCYHKIILTISADKKGAVWLHNVVTYLFLYMSWVLKGGYVYVTRPSTDVDANDFKTRVMDPATRDIRRLSVGASLLETLAINGLDQAR